MMRLTARVRECPPDHRGGYDLAIDDVEATGETYEDAKATIERQVPEGWQVLFFKVDRG